MTLHDYLSLNLSRIDPYPAIDHVLRAERHADGRISFYIHAQGRDSDTVDYWVEPDGRLTVKSCTGGATKDLT